MSRIELAREIGDDFDRILDHLAHHDVENSASRIDDIIQTINVLEYNPLIGRPVRSGMNELALLVIGRDAHGYVALYRYVAAIDTVFVLAIRSQREAGYARE
jgi:toxin ParE1/3/4